MSHPCVQHPDACAAELATYILDHFRRHQFERLVIRSATYKLVLNEEDDSIAGSFTRRSGFTPRRTGVHDLYESLGDYIYEGPEITNFDYQVRGVEPLNPFNIPVIEKFGIFILPRKPGAKQILQPILKLLIQDDINDFVITEGRKQARVHSNYNVTLETVPTEREVLVTGGRRRRRISKSRRRSSSRGRRGKA